MSDLRVFEGNCNKDGVYLIRIVGNQRQCLLERTSLLEHLLEVECNGEGKRETGTERRERKRDSEREGERERGSRREVRDNYRREEREGPREEKEMQTDRERGGRKGKRG